jgi:hypothetical protein
VPTQPIFCPMGTGDPFSGGKARPGNDADHSPPSSAEVKYEQELYLLSPHAPPWRVAGLRYFFFYLNVQFFRICYVTQSRTTTVTHSHLKRCLYFILQRVFELVTFVFSFSLYPVLYSIPSLLKAVLQHSVFANVVYNHTIPSPRIKTSTRLIGCAELHNNKSEGIKHSLCASERMSCSF